MKVLFITLSNIGDCILTLPSLDLIRERIKDAKITVMAGPRTKDLFAGNPFIEGLIVYEKQLPLREKIRLFRKLQKERFDVVVDLRNSLFGFFLSAKHKIPLFGYLGGAGKHMRKRHLLRVEGALKGIKNNAASSKPALSLHTGAKDMQEIERLLKDSGLRSDDRIAVLSCGARNSTKRWPMNKFVGLIDRVISEFGFKVILAGDKDDAAVSRYVLENVKSPVINLTARTSLLQFACLLKKAGLVITNDSATVHLASYLEKPVVGIFGPTSETKYGPWSALGAVVKKDIVCRPCEKSLCKYGSPECLEFIKVEDVMGAARDLVAQSPEPKAQSAGNFKRILIVRTDRLGDVVLSTPVIKAMRDAYPGAYIAMMVGPYTKDVVEGNPYLDQVIIYDKDVKHKSWARSIRFALNLKKKKFDLCLVLHPSNRVHLVTFLAGIKRRIGYNRNFGFLLTDRIEHTKQLGQKHELEYNLDLVRFLGIEPADKNLFMPVSIDAQKYADELLAQEGIVLKDKILAIHPGASCPSRVWPNERFAEVARRLAEKYGFKVIVVAAAKDISLARKVAQGLNSAVANLAGRTSIAQLAGILKRCTLLISNDSGPVHIASAVGVPVISIFGRKQEGLSPKRWGPVGLKDKFLHKQVGCIECLAHNCRKEFACLKAITVEDVLQAADSILT